MNSLHPARSGFLTFDRMTTEQAAARRVIDRMRAERATASDPLPAPQQREARIVEATQAEPAPQQGDGMSEAVARVLARHRAQAAAAAGTSTPDAPAVAGDPAPTAQDKTTKESAARETKDAARVPGKGLGWNARQAEVIRRHREAAATTEPGTGGSNDASAATRRAQQPPGRDEGRTRH